MMSDSKSPRPDRADQPHQARPQRVLACVNCQQRKVKCDRRFPCAHCVRLKAKCVPATQTRSRKRRFPERELLSRLRQYEELLRQNNVPFDPLHKQEESTHNDEGDGSEDEQPADEVSPTTSPKDIWQAMSHGFKNNGSPYSLADSSHESPVGMSWDQSFQNDDHVILASRKEQVELHTLHPEPVHIFRLWQIYLENVNPLLMITHHPSLQGKVIEAASNPTTLDANLEALLFAIYSTAVHSLSAQDCENFFALPKDDLLTRHQFGCQQALLNCRFLRTDNRDCLTALFLFLVSLQSRMHPRSLGSMLAIAISIGQRMGIHSESSLVRCSPFEAEMRRRLWWAIACFEARIGELSESKISTLNPTWDCKVPLNVNESSLWPEMKSPPNPSRTTTDSIFIVTRSENGEYLRHAPFHCDFRNPALKLIAKSYGDMGTFENRLQEQYLKSCESENALHCMAVWMSHVQLSRSHLLESYAKGLDSTARLTEAQIESGIKHALRMLECDTKILTSPLTKGFTWIVAFYFPFPAYMHLVQELVVRPTGKYAARAWDLMNDNYEARFTSEDSGVDALFRVFAGVVLKAWEILEKAATDSGAQIPTPKLVQNINKRLTKAAQRSADDSAHTSNEGVDPGINDIGYSMPMDMNETLFYGLGGRPNFQGMDNSFFSNMGPSQNTVPDNMTHFNWASMVWELRNGRGWY